MNDILIAIDSSEESLVALKMFLSISSLRKNKLHLLNVQKVRIPHEEYFTQGDRRGLIKYHTEVANEILDKFIEHIEEGQEYVTAVRMGDPVTEIMDYADEIDADLIVMGSHGSTGLTAVVMGSVSTKVMTYCKRPVMITRPPHLLNEEFKKKYLEL